MKWVCSDAELKSGLEWFRLPKSAQADHDNLERYCGRMENGGVIRGAKEFRRVDWQRVAGTTQQGIEALVVAALCAWEGEDLRVVGYNIRWEELKQKASDLNTARVNLRWQKERERMESYTAKSTAESGAKSAKKAKLGDTDGNTARSMPGNTARTTVGTSAGNTQADRQTGRQTDLRSTKKRSTTTEAAALPEGGGGSPDGSRLKEMELLGQFLDDYPKPIAARERSLVVQAWDGLHMSPRAMRELLVFAKKHPTVTRIDESTGLPGRWAKKPQQFLSEIWAHELKKRRRAHAAAQAANGVKHV